MDNVTHTLIGFALGRVARGRKVEADPALTWAAIIASNLPDLDFIFPPLLSIVRGQPQLEYLLFHRGHSHTFAFAPLLALIATVLALWVGSERSLRRALKIYALSLVALCLHIVADSWNNYGVHPFYPLDDHWFYGDFIFILEPLIWMALIPLAIEECRSRFAKTFWGVLGAGLLIYCGMGLYTPYPVPIFIAAWAAGIAWIQWKVKGPWPGLAAVLAVLVAFGIGSRVARARVTALASPSENTVQLVLTPKPANPFCWRATLVSAGASGAYRVRSANVSLWPGEFALPDGCGYYPGSTSAPEAPVTLASSAGVRWIGEFAGTVSELRKLDETNCQFRAFLRFARAPFWMGYPSGAVVAGDLRFGGGRRHAFAEIEIPPKPDCPSWIPPWIPPLASILEH